MKNLFLKKLKKSKKMKKINICIGLSDLHFGNENCLYETLHYCIDELLTKLEKLKNEHEINNVFLILNGDIVSGTFVYRNQYLESQVQKNETIILGGAYLVYTIVEKIEELLGISIKVFITIGTHEGWFKPHPENFSVGVSRRLVSYGVDCRYAATHLLLNIAHGFENEYIVCAFHGWGSADYSSASPSVIRELTRAHSQVAKYRRIIIDRFLLSHTHWLELDRTVLGVTFDVTGGFQKWGKTVSTRETGLLYYIVDEDGNFEVNKVSGMKHQLIEEKAQSLNTNNLRYVYELIEEGIKHEIDIGLLKEPEEGLEL